MVTMIMATTVALLASPVTTRSNTSPVTTATPIATTTASGRPTSSRVSRNTLAIPPIMTNSPCAKLITRLAL